jgi:hypothetical protein
MGITNGFGRSGRGARTGRPGPVRTPVDIPLTRLATLGWLKAAGALGLVAGFAVPSVGIAAATGLVLYFVGALVTVGRAGWYEHLPYPTAFLLLSVAALVLRLATV